MRRRIAIDTVALSDMNRRRTTATQSTHMTATRTETGSVGPERKSAFWLAYTTCPILDRLIPPTGPTDTMEEDREVDLHQLDKTIDVLVLSNQYQKAKEILVDEYESVKKAGDKKSVDAVLGLLVFVCGASDPPCLTEGRDFCILREANIG